MTEGHNNPDRIGSANYSQRRNQENFAAVQARAREAGRQQRAAEKKAKEIAKENKKKKGGDPILSVIGPNATLGSMIYDFPADPILATIRGIEARILNPILYRENPTRFDTMTQWDQRTLDQQVAEQNAETIPHKKLHYFAEQHRQGHLDGLLKVMQEGDSTELLHIFLNDQELSLSQITQRVAALFEAAQSDPEVLTELIHTLDKSEVWLAMKAEHERRKQEGKAVRVANVPESTQFLFPDCQLTTLRQVDVEEVPTAFKFLANRWRAVIAKSTLERARRFIQTEQDIADAEALATEIAKAMIEEMR